jgi:HAD superfamily hydrolase (TIGR01509 family)
MADDRPVVIFDIDGTLVDTNYLHAVAWRRAFLETGHDVPTAWVHHRVGMGAGQLLDELIGGEDERVKDAWRRHFDELKPEVRAFPGAAALLRAVAAAGGKVVLGSSSEEADLEVLLDALDAGDVIEAVTSSGDVDEAKPSPDVFRVALDKAGGTADRAIVVGDTVWDVRAARAAGLDCVCVRTGGIDGALLEAEGAVAVYRDPEELTAQLEGSPIGRLLQASVSS